MFFSFKKKVEKQKTDSRKIAKSLVVGFFGVVAFATILISGLISYTKADSAGTTPAPQFNFLQGDAEMLSGTKQGGASWSDPVTGVNIGDEVAVAFYVHNGVAGSTAHSTYLRVNMTGTPSNSIGMTSQLWSQETQAISDTVVSGSIVGKSGLTINLPSGITGRAEYVAGTTRQFINSNGTFVYDKDLADGITQNSGLNIGDMQGCWTYARLITFRVKIRGLASFQMDKTVRAEPSTTWLQSTQAFAGDMIDYRVAVENTGTEAGTVVLKDVKPSYMTYQNGSTYYYDYQNPNGVQLSDALFTSAGLTLNVPADNLATTNADEGIVYVSYKLKIDDVLPPSSGGTTCEVGYALNNVAQLWLNGTQIFTDTAGVVTRCSTKVIGLSKQVQTGPTTWGEQNTAKLGDIVTYKITVKNNGNTDMANVKVRDVIPQYSNYVVGSTTVDGTAVGDNIVTTDGFNLGTLTATQQKVITLKVTIYGCVPIGNYILTNTGYARADGVSEVSDTATTVVSVLAPTI